MSADIAVGDEVWVQVRLVQWGGVAMVWCGPWCGTLPEGEIIRDMAGISRMRARVVGIAMPLVGIRPHGDPMSPEVVWIHNAYLRRSV
jgi:hypothetical protein